MLFDVSDLIISSGFDQSQSCLLSDEMCFSDWQVSLLEITAALNSQYERSCLTIDSLKKIYLSSCRGENHFRDKGSSRLDLNQKVEC